MELFGAPIGKPISIPVGESQSRSPGGGSGATLPDGMEWEDGYAMHWEDGEEMEWEA